MKGPPPLGPIIGESMAIRRARELVDRYAPTALPILLVGPTGTGKDLLARHIHVRSGRRGRIVGVNCGALPHDMAEGLLFGYDRGAFSGAVRRHRGHFECADGGTLFLDELSSLPLAGQAKLLRALDAGEVQRLGDEIACYVDARVVAAVQEDVLDRVARGALRSDLYERLSGVTVEVPPLADRPEDIAPLAAHFAALQRRTLEAETARVLTRHSWPGNVRELRLVIERAGALVLDGTLPPWAVRDAIALGAPTRTSRVLRRHAAPRVARGDVREVREAGLKHAWDVRAMARALGLGRSGLYARLKRLGTSLHDLRQSTLSTGRPVDTSGREGAASA